jgi:6,7-dimethyl-8-ribityllumazine synthase
MSQNNTSLLRTDDLKDLKHPRVAIIYTEWNAAIATELVKGCEKVLAEFNTIMIEKLAVPGCFEIPFACKQLYDYYEAFEESPEVIIVFGAVIRGGTPHFDYVCKAVTDGVLELNLRLPIPVIFGILTLDDEQQAWERLGGVHGHKGEEAAITALKMIKNGRRGD